MPGVTIAILHNAVDERSSVADRDVLVQVEAVEVALHGGGYPVERIPVTLNLAETDARLRELRPACVFNLVETLGDADRLMTLVPLLLEARGIPFTGADSASLLTVNDKVRAKRALLRAGLPTPSWWTSTSGWSGSPSTRVIIKAQTEHASLGLNASSVVSGDDPLRMSADVHAARDRTGHVHFAEAFVEGREFNLSVLAGEVLPPAEIDFSSFASDQVRIVGHDAKWVEDSFEYAHTPRTFAFPTEDAALLARLVELAGRVCACFELTSYARVDVRVDPQGLPWVLEVNANPCLSPDAGFAAALAQAGLSYDGAIQSIVASALSEA